MTEDDRIAKVARAICAEKCAFMGDLPCWQIGEGLSPDCDEPGCLALAQAAVAASIGDAMAQLAEIEEIFTKDRVRTSEHNILVRENKKQAATIARLTAALEKIPIAIREAELTSPYSTGRTPAFQYGLSDGYEAAAQVADECVRAALQKETDR
jgi:hypothetical protein